MSILLKKCRHDRTLLSISELTRLLNIPDSQMDKAIREGIIRPVGTIGRVTVIALTEGDLEELCPRFQRPVPDLESCR
jgi:hypothetical protein